MVEKHPDGTVIADADLQIEFDKLSAAVDAFAVEMKAALHEKARQGRSGWNNPSLRDEMYTAMLANGAGIPLAVGQEAHIANFAMMLWHTRPHG